MSDKEKRATDDRNDAVGGAAAAKPAADTAPEPEAVAPNPPRTTTGDWFTAPKFGSSGSAGAELDPGPERD